jgi:23S rRNA (cytidine1920-2'-O)/16S rRNA (cytidine1409-2'-O)-methyltransferase
MARQRIPLIDLLRLHYPQRGEKELFAEVLRGHVRVGGETVLKPGIRVAADCAIEMKGEAHYASRGGEKLARALDEWGVVCEGRYWLDAGCSTGGFTDCLLERGAAGVYAVDVGENLLAWRLRRDPRVRVMEQTNVMKLRREDLDPLPDCAVADLSFRSLRGAAAHILTLTREAWGVFLVKPQFEWKDAPAAFHGVVRDRVDLLPILRGLVDGLGEEGVLVEHAVASPLRGRKGNREFFFWLRSGARRLRESGREAVASALDALLRE